MSCRCRVYALVIVANIRERCCATADAVVVVVSVLEITIRDCVDHNGQYRESQIQHQYFSDFRQYLTNQSHSISRRDCFSLTQCSARSLRGEFIASGRARAGNGTTTPLVCGVRKATFTELFLLSKMRSLRVTFFLRSIAIAVNMCVGSTC
jgi:hypothetical protein